MQIAGKDMDVREIIGRAAAKIRKDAGYRYRSMDSLRKDLERDIISNTWRGMLEELDTDAVEGKAPNAEAAVAALIRRGLGKDRIWYHYNAYRIRLTNREYGIRRTVSGFNAGGCQVKGLGAEDFADLLLKFDSIVPIINVTAEGLYKELLEELEKERRAEKARQLAQTTVESILGEFIRPLGIEYHASIHGDRVSVHLTQTREADFDLPISELAERIKDVEAVLASLRVVEGEPAEKVPPLFRDPHHFTI